MDFFTIMVIYSWQQGRIKRGGVELPLPPELFLGKVKKRYKEDVDGEGGGGTC